MARDSKNGAKQVSNQVVPTLSVVEDAKQVVSLPAPTESLQPGDKAALDQAKARKALSLANAEKVIAQDQVAELELRNLILQLAMKYNLSNKDQIAENGDITRFSTDGDVK